jgi:CRP/FNR family transcriptional regulator, cyclic AMP receptor protein
MSFMSLPNHNDCMVLSSLFRGKLCEQLTRRPGRLFAPGEFIFLRGDPAQSIYFLRAGLVKTSTLTESGEETILAVHKPSEIFGELCMCKGERREQASAMEESEIVEIHLQDLITRLQQERQLMSEFLTNVCQHLAQAYEQMEMLTLETTLGRVAHQLLQFAEDFGTPTPDGTEIDHYFSQEELARIVGASREGVSSSLNRLRTLGLVSYSRKGLITIKTKALATHLSTAKS